MSQEYTPVSWQDETTSQQGTLINAERLNQMQTAHHFTDGFEEVDEIPTEDPGVDYHKVVYCTADSTFYRWDGTQWTADIDEDTKHLLDQEIARATQAEGELAQDIEDEATARAQADTALGERITAEAGAREGADTALGARIDAEAEYRADVDRQIYADIGRLNGETLPLRTGSSTPTIQNAIGANEGAISNLTSVVDGLSYDLGQEVTDRENADTGLAADITAEVQARAAAIASLQAGVYTKTEADNLLAAKADVTALTDGSVTKVGTADLGTDTKPIKLVGGVPTAVTNDFVSTTGNQDVAGIKTFMSEIRRRGADVGGASTTSYDIMRGYDSNSTRLWELCGTSRPNGSTRVYINARKTDGTLKTVILNDADDTNTNPDTAATLGYIDSYAPMVRTTGNADISGKKLYLAPNYSYSLGIMDAGLDITNPTSLRVHLMPFVDSNEVNVASLRYVTQADGLVAVQLEIRKTDGTYKYIVLGDNQ